MQAITTVGLDIAKSVFQVHGVDAQGSASVRHHSPLLGRAPTPVRLRHDVVAPIPAISRHRHGTTPVVTARHQQELFRKITATPLSPEAYAQAGSATSRRRRLRPGSPLPGPVS